MYLERGNTSQALDQFRAALKLNPKLTPARVGIVHALSKRKEFPEALEAVNQAVENGLPESEAALLKAGVLLDRANYLFETAGKEFTVKTCEQAIAEDLDPAIALAQQQAETAAKPAEPCALAGDLFRQKLRVENAEDALLLKAYRQAVDLDKKDEIAAREKDRSALALKMRSNRALSRLAYQEAIKRNPTAVKPRIALAQDALVAYYPRTDEAKALLDPLMKATPPAREALYWMAIAEWYSGDSASAIENMRVLNNMPEPRREDLAKEAEILIAGGHWPEARAVADRLLKTGSKETDVRWVIGQVLLHEGHADEALDYLQNIFVPSRTGAIPRWAQARLVLAQALMSAAPPKREQAITQYTKVLEDYKATRPANSRTAVELRETAYQACIALAGASRQLGPKTAQEYARQALDIAPERPEAFQLAHDLSQAAGLPPEKIEMLVLIHATGLARDPAQQKAACEFLQKAYEEFKDTREKGAQIRLLRANLLEKAGAYQEAAAAYGELQKDFPKARPVAYDLARMHVQLGHFKEAREVYESVLAAYPTDMRAVGALVGVCLRMDDVAGAHAVLDRAASASNSAAVWATILKVFMNENRLDEAVTLAKSYVEKNPASAPARCMLAEILWAKGDVKGAKSAFDETLKLAPDFPPAVRSALLDLEENRSAEAVTRLRAAAEKSKTDATKTDLAMALQTDGKFQEAADILKGLSDGAPGPAVALDLPRWYLAVLLAGEGHLQNAGALSDLLAEREFLESPADRLQLLRRVAASAKPRDLAAKVNLVLWLSMNACPGVLEQAELLVKQLPDEPLTACWRAKLLDAAGKHEEAAQACSDILSAHPGFAIARLLLAASQERNGKADEAIRSLDQALNEVPPEMVAGVQLQRAKLLSDAGRLDEAIAAYQTITSPPGMAAVAGNELAWLYVTKRNDPESALPVARQAVRLSPNVPAILDTLGWVLYVKGDNDEALDVLRKAKAGLPGNPTVRYHLGLALLKIGRKDDAKSELEEALQISKDFPEAADAAARLAGI
jgi:tetratricopeptide (TPR) repeat protein